MIKWLLSDWVTSLLWVVPLFGCVIGSEWSLVRYRRLGKHNASYGDRLRWLTNFGLVISLTWLMLGSMTALIYHQRGQLTVGPVSLAILGGIGLAYEFHYSHRFHKLRRFYGQE